MRFHEALHRDPRTRFYLPVRKVLLNTGVEHPERLIDNPEFQTSIAYCPPDTLFPPGSSIVLDFGEAFHGGIRFILVGFSDKIRIQFGESVSEALGPSNQDCSRKDAQVELPVSGMLEYGNTVFRFVKITNTGKVPIRCQNILGVALERDLEITGSFECSDDRLNQIWKTAIRTVHLCMQDYLYDGAKRDRIIWMGDMHPEIHGILSAFSDTSIIRDSFRFLMNQAPPEKPMNGEFYTYSCWFLIALWDYVCWTSDKVFLLSCRDYVVRMLKKFVSFAGEDGVEHVPGFRFLDWPNENNPDAKHAGIQALLLWTMNSGAKLLQELGEDSSAVSAAAERLRRHVPDLDGQKAPAALQTISGLADRRDVLEADPFHGISTFYGFYMLLAKETLPALQLIRKYWGAMLDYGATSFWEDFDLNWIKNASRIDEPPVPGKDDLHADFGNYCYKGLRHSLSHGWSCGPAPFLTERVLGVRFPRPGQVIVSPDLGDLKWVKGTVPTPFGLIHVEANADGIQEIVIPDGLQRVKNPNSELKG